MGFLSYLRTQDIERFGSSLLTKENCKERLELLAYVNKAKFESLRIDFGKNKEIFEILNQALVFTFVNFETEFYQFTKNTAEAQRVNTKVTALLIIGKLTSFVQEISQQLVIQQPLLTEELISKQYLQTLLSTDNPELNILISSFVRLNSFYSKYQLSKEVKLILF